MCTVHFTDDICSCLFRLVSRFCWHCWCRCCCCCSLMCATVWGMTRRDYGQLARAKSATKNSNCMHEKSLHSAWQCLKERQRDRRSDDETRRKKTHEKQTFMHLNYCILFAYFVIGMNETPENCAISVAVKPILARTPPNVLSSFRSLSFCLVRLRVIFPSLLSIFVRPSFSMWKDIAIRCVAKAV